jgi:hypothetical protein
MWSEVGRTVSVQGAQKLIDEGNTMATLSANYIINIGEDPLNTVGSQFSSTSISPTDNDAGSTSFEVGETISLGSGGQGVYQGYVVLNGANFMYVEGLNGSATLYSEVVDPNNFDSGLTTGDAFSEPLVGQDIDQDNLCFAAGTLIATPDGECTVEDLKIGDLVTTADGRTVPVKWIGRQTVHKIFTPAERFTPVRFAAGALGNSLPHTDLVLTADHALILDGLAINASALVNGTTIAFEPVANLPERVTYYHIETEDHDVILANGAAAETYVDYIGRRAFDNFAEYTALYGDERDISEMLLPRVSAARLVPPAIRERLADGRAA